MNEQNDIVGTIALLVLILVVVPALGVIAFGRRHLHELVSAMTLVLAIVALVRIRKALS